ncbi:MAG: SBBP repeat-containing protein [Bacteroidales bacterium]
MKIIIFALKLMLLSAIVLSQNNNITTIKNHKNLFIENKGQWPDEVKFLAKIDGMNAWITQNGVVYDYYQFKKKYKKSELEKISDHKKYEFIKDNTLINSHIIKSNFKNCNINFEIKGINKLNTYHNYYNGKNKNNWASKVSLYKTILLKDIYNGIDIKYYFDKELLRYDFIVKPGADLSQIKMSMEGAENYFINDKSELEIETSLGKVIHKDIIAFQVNENGKKEIIPITFKKNEKGNINFSDVDYDKSKELIIDPLVFSTFLGGKEWFMQFEDLAKSMQVDSKQNVIATGTTYTRFFPTTVGAIQSNFNIFVTHCIISKLNSKGSKLLYSTYLDGFMSEDGGNKLAVDSEDNIYVTGYTSYKHFPTTNNCFQAELKGASDVFVIKLNSSCTDLIYSSLVGGEADDFSTSISIDNLGNAYVTGYTRSKDFSTTSGCIKSNLSGNSDLFILKLNSTGSKLLYSTLVGGEGNDSGKSITVDNTGRAYVCGVTNSSDFIVSDESVQSNLRGENDIFILKLDSLGTGLEYSTLIGGDGEDNVASICINDAGNAFVCGVTQSTDFTISNEGYQTEIAGFSDGYILKLNKDGSKILYSTYIGGSGKDEANSIVVDENGIAYVVGETSSLNFPTNIEAFQFEKEGGTDAFVLKLNSEGTDLLYSTYLGGGRNDKATGISLGENDIAYILGTTKSENFPTTDGVFQSELKGNSDIFITKLNFTNNLNSLGNKQIKLFIHGNSSIRVGPPNYYDIIYRNYSSTPTGQFGIKLNTFGGVHIKDITTTEIISGEKKVLPFDSLSYTDFDDELFLLVEPLEPRETRSFRLNLGARPDEGLNKTAVAPLVVGAVVWIGKAVIANYIGDVMVESCYEVFNPNQRGIKGALKESMRNATTFENAGKGIAGKASELIWKASGELILAKSIFDCFDNMTKGMVETIIGSGVIKPIKMDGYSELLFLKGNVKSKELRKVMSWDPNAKEGPTGFGEKGFMASNDRMYYTIFFENKKEATAPAWKIVVLDTLNSNVFDPETVEFGEMSHSMGKATRDGNILRWEFVEIELPPNHNPPEGEGYVKFSVEPRKNLYTGTELKNKADITFDINKPIATNEVINTLDFEAPITNPGEAEFDHKNNLVKLNWTVDDSKGSGQKFTEIYSSKNGQPYELTAISNNDTISIPVTANDTYKFKFLSEDNVGNRESISSKEIVWVSVEKQENIEPTKYSLDQNYPNPFNPTTTIKYSIPEEVKVKLIVYDILGRKISTLVNKEQKPGEYVVNFYAGHLASGVYFYRIEAGKFYEAKKLLLIK